MNARDRKLLAQGINPATGQALTAPVLMPASAPRVVSRPASATAAPWAGSASPIVPAPAVVASAVVPAPVTPRQWYDTGERGESKSGNPTIVLLSSMRNGGFFRCTFPADAVAAIANGKVLGPNGQPVTF